MEILSQAKFNLGATVRSTKCNLKYTILDFIYSSADKSYSYRCQDVSDSLQPTVIIAKDELESDFYQQDAEYPIRSEWKDYYLALEDIRQAGYCNMWGAAPYLAINCKISQQAAEDILVNWIHNYDTLNKIYNFRG